MLWELRKLCQEKKGSKPHDHNLARLQQSSMFELSSNAYPVWPTLQLHDVR